MTLLSPSRGRSLAVATIATLALGATGAVTAADAGTHYTPTKCNNEITKLAKKYGGAKSAKQVAANQKKYTASLKALAKHHGCKIAG